jgi:hypothetical protein
MDLIILSQIIFSGVTMFLNTTKLSIASLVLMSASSFASVTTHFGTINETYSNANFNEFSLTAGGVDITVTGWSDTDDDGQGNVLSGDDKITEAVDFDRNGNGWSMHNADEINSNNCGYHHSADNLGTTCGYQDYDMFLIEFSEEVNLSAATSSWLYGQSSGKNTAASNNELTVAALSNENLAGKDWSDVKNNQTISSGYAGFSYMGTVASELGYNTANYEADFTSGSANVSGTFSKFWLVGALNTVFGGDKSLEGNDGFKLSGVTFSKNGGTPPPSTTVPEPTSIIMFGLALFGFAARRKIK